MRIIKEASLLVLSLLALGAAIAAASASALPPEYNVKTTPVTAKGGIQSFVAGELIFSCSKGEFKYTGIIGPFEEIDVAPAYKECSVRDNPAVITVTKLQYALKKPTEVKIEEFSVPVALVGETGASMKLTATISGEKCEVTMLPQELSKTGTKFQDNSGNTGGEVKARLEGIAYKTNGKCAGSIPNEGKARYEGNASETGIVV